MFIVYKVNCICWDWVICFDVSCLFVRLYSYWSPVWPVYELLHVLYFNLYMPLEFILFSGILLRSWLYMVLLVWKATIKLVFLNKLVTLCVYGMWYMKVNHFCCCVRVTFFCVLSIILFFSLRIICNRNPVYLATVRIMFHSCCFACSVIGSVSYCLRRSCMQQVYVLMDGWMCDV